MSSPTRKRQKLSSPRQSPSIETIPISSESEDEDKPLHIPLIHVEDISDDEKDIKPSIVHTPLGIRSSSETPSSSSTVNSPLKMLSQANIFDNLRNACVPSTSKTSSPNTGVSNSPKIEVSKADSQSNVISTTTMLSPFSNENRISTLGSPRYMVQEISSTVVTHKRFLLTGLNNCKHETKERIKIMIKQLGGEYIECPNFVERCTHIVLGKPNTGEKYMGGLMTGKWLLKTDYVEDSYAEGYWLEEEAYEWTKDTIERLNPDSDPELAKLASSARRCRLRYNAEGPFHGWTASILSNHPRRLECYERLFKAGGGRVINIQDYRKRKDELTFILVDNPDQTHIPLKSPTVPLLRINYIHNVVLEDEKPDRDLYKVKREDAQNELPTVPWICTFSNVRKQINLTSKKKCDRKLLDYIDGVMCSESWGGILLPLTSNQRPPSYMLRSVINKSLLPRSSSEFGTIRQVMSDLYILSWFIQPMHDNRDYYASLMQLKDKPNYNADKFLFLFDDAVKSDAERKYPQSPRYLIFWLELLEKDFYNWERRTNFSKPLVERIMNSWHHVRPVFKTFLRSYTTVMGSDSAQENLKMAMNSQLIVYFTCNEIKRVAKQEEQYQQGTTLDVIAETVRGVMTTTLRTRDVRRVHVLIHMLSFSYTLMTTVFNKVLLTLSQATVPQHYKVLAERPPSWEKFFNFFLHVRYTDATPPSPSYTIEIYLILLTAMFRALLATHSKPPSELNPLDKTIELQENLAEEGEISLSSRLMLRLLVKAVS